MYTDELKHYGILGMKWGRRKATTPVSVSERNQKTYTPPTNPYTKAVHRNALATVNRGSQAVLSIGLSRVASAVAIARGKKNTAKVLNSIGNLTAAGFGAALIVDMARNNTDRGD